MPKLTVVQANGASHELDVENGTSVMRATVENMIDGVYGDCGGSASCATCHCYVDDAWVAKLELPTDVEKDLLDCVINPESNSRLSCQLIMSDALDGLIVRLPASQY